MKKLLTTFFITISLIGFTLPLISYAQTVKDLGNGGKVLIDDTTGEMTFFDANGKVTTPPEDSSSGSACGGLTSFLSSNCIQQSFFSLLQVVGNFILALVSWVLWLAGTILNLAIITMVVHMKDFIDKIGAIFVVWRVLRDFVNMFFIFILLVIAIQTILQTGNYRKMLINLVLVALFLNFSFFFTGVMIDVSNTVALLFYKGFASGQCLSADTSSVAAQGGADATQLAIQTGDGCMSYNIVQSLRLQTIYVAPTNAGINTATSSSQALANVSDSADSLQVNGYGATIKFLTTVIAGSILMIIVAGVFLASAVLIFFRFVELIMLLMLSPLAFASIVLPSTSRKIWSKWWDKLIAQLIFAPAYFMFLWISMKIITSGTLIGTLSVTNASFVDAFKGNMSEMFGLIANYVIIIMLLGYSLYLAKELGAQGVGAATKVANGFQGYVGRNTVGRAASRIANSEAMKNFRKDNPTIGRMAQAPFKAAAGYDFSGRKGGYEKAQKDFVKGEEEFAKTLGPNPVTVRNAELRLEQTKTAEEQSQKDVDATFIAKETKLDAELTMAEARVKKAQEDFDKSRSSRKLGPDGSFVMGTDAIDAEKELNESKLERERLNSEKNKMASEKAVAMKAVSYRENEKKSAQDELDRLNGVSQDEAKRRATNIVRKEVSEGKRANDKQEVAAAIKKMTDDIVKANKGVAKTNQEAFAKAVEKGYGEAISKIIPTQKGKSVIKNVVNVVITDRVSRVTASNSIRKLAKGKSKKDELYETFTKAAKEEAEEEEAPKPDKKPDDGGAKKDEGKTS